ncbi:MAG: hypothetical protein OJF47_003423 [Nitrospira sp.]|jgi:thiamine pyrophosphate-dependent acetolactate synthase large subunit-like protein|nr:MAG: hypothetical protein OJF47_003423 [Nitrospira sp.]
MKQATGFVPVSLRGSPSRRRPQTWRSFFIALWAALRPAGKRDATHLELSEDVAAQEVMDAGAFDLLQVQHPVLLEPIPIQVARAVEMIGKARRPVILAGKGVVRSSAASAPRDIGWRDRRSWGRC